MNKNLIIGIVITLLIAGGAYAVKNNKSTVPASQSIQETVSESNEFAKAIESGKPTICTMTKSTDSIEYSLKGNKMRIKSSTSTSEGSGATKIYVGNMISDEKFFYAWDDASKQGTKMSLLTPSPSAKTSAEQLTAPKFESKEDYDNLKNEGYVINCKASTIDDSVFIPPTDIKFVDPTEMLKAIPSPDSAGNYDMSQLKELQKQYGGE